LRSEIIQDHAARMERSPLASRTVLSAGYDAERQVLELEFSSGRVYQYDGVPPATYDWLLRTSSKGGFVTRMINGRYPYRDVTQAKSEPVDLEAALRASLAPNEP
jgi:hypothetical protein